MPDPSTPSFALVSTPRACQTLPCPHSTSFRHRGHVRPFHTLVRLRFDTEGTSDPSTPSFALVSACQTLLRPRFDTEGTPNPSLPSFALVSTPRARQTLPRGPRPRLPSFRHQGHARPFLALVCPSFDANGMPDPSTPSFQCRWHARPFLALVSMQRARQTCPHPCCLSPVSRVRHG